MSLLIKDSANSTLLFKDSAVESHKCLIIQGLCCGGNSALLFKDSAVEEIVPYYSKNP